MRWQRASAPWRVLGLFGGACGIGAAWYLTRIGAAGIEDVPPPFILLAGLAGLAQSGIALAGRYPKLGA